MKTLSDQLLLDCLRRDRGGPPIEKLAALPMAEWVDLLAAAGRHSLGPLLYHALKPVFEQIEPPAEVVEQLRTTYLASAARNIRLYHELGQVLVACSAAAIPVILLKGAHLAEFVYGNIALRPMSDIDLLVKQSDLSKVWNVMIRQGYSTSRKEIGGSLSHLPPFTRRDSVTVEIHFNIIDPPFSSKVDLDGLWDRTQEVSFNGIEALMLSPEDLILHLCLHSALNHGFENGLMPLIDIFNTVGHYEAKIDWERVLVGAANCGTKRCLWLVLAMAKKLAGASIPNRIVETIGVNNDGLDALKCAQELLFADSQGITPRMASLLNDEELFRKFVKILGNAFPPRQTMVNIYPLAKGSLSIYLLYLSRIWNLFKKRGAIICQVLTSRGELNTIVEQASNEEALMEWLAVE